MAVSKLSILAMVKMTIKTVINLLVGLQSYIEEEIKNEKN